jgi:LuxR family maltose regulon positive regulatory protein
LALAAWVEGDVTVAVRTFTEAVASMMAAGNLADGLGSTVVLADMWLAAGRPCKARRLYTGALATSEAHGMLFGQTSALLHVGLSELDLEAGDLTRARWHLDTALALDDHVSQTANHFRWFLAMGRLMAADGDHESALTLLTQAQTAYRPGFFVDVRPLPALTARVLISAGRLLEARDWAAGHDWSTSEVRDYRDEFDQLTYVRVLLAEHRAHPGPADLGDALDLLEALLGPARRQERWGSVVEIHLLTALVREARGQRPAAADALTAALAEAREPDAYTRMFLAEGEPMRSLLLYAQRVGVGDGHADRILAAYGRPAPSQVLVDPLSEREVQVLRLVARGRTNREIAEVLVLSEHTVRRHLQNVFGRLGVSSRAAAATFAVQHELI